MKFIKIMIVCSLFSSPAFSFSEEAFNVHSRCEMVADIAKNKDASKRHVNAYMKIGKDLGMTKNQIISKSFSEPKRRHFYNITRPLSPFERIRQAKRYYEKYDCHLNKWVV